MSKRYKPSDYPHVERFRTVKVKLKFRVYGNEQHALKAVERMTRELTLQKFDIIDFNAKEVGDGAPSESEDQAS